MRLLVLLAFLFSAAPASGADWTRYHNARFGYAIAVPPGFHLEQASDNGDGARFLSAGGDTLTVWGGHSLDGAFAAELEDRIAADESAGWEVTYRAEADNWVTYSGTRRGRVLYARSVATCSGRGTANFRLEYDSADLDAMNPVVVQLARSLTVGRDC